MSKNDVNNCTIIFFIDKIFKSRSHLPMFARYFEKKIILNNYFWLRGINILTTETNNYFLPQKYWHGEDPVLACWYFLVGSTVIRFFGST